MQADDVCLRGRNVGFCLRAGNMGAGVALASGAGAACGLHIATTFLKALSGFRREDWGSACPSHFPFTFDDTQTERPLLLSEGPAG